MNNHEAHLKGTMLALSASWMDSSTLSLPFEAGIIYYVLAKCRITRNTSWQYSRGGQTWFRLLCRRREKEVRVGVEMSIHASQIIFSRPHTVKQSQVIMQICFFPRLLRSPLRYINIFFCKQLSSPVKSLASPKVWMWIRSDSARDKNGKTADAV